MRVRAGLGALLALAFLSFPHSASADESVDLELVLAIDASSSVDDEEWDLQRRGYAAAFADVRVKAALRSGPMHKVAVAVVVWADATVPKWESDWFRLAAPEDASRFSAFMSRLPRGAIGGTGIGAGVAAAIRMFERNGFAAPRQVVDVSGDGRETPAREYVVLMPMAHAMAEARGVTINGIAVTNEDPYLAQWYEDNLISGPGSFVLTASDYADFGRAILKKLVKEIEWQERLSKY
jgi:Ca-activated chloride channel family protein